MWRYLAGGAGALAMAGAGVLMFSGQARPDSPLAPAPSMAASMPAQSDEPATDTLPEASPRTREQKRFGRYDKDRNGQITREEYLLSRRKAYAKLDRDGDGRLSFEEWAAKTSAKFAAADRDRSGAMSAAEFATTAVKRKPRARVNCPPAPRAPDEGAAED